MTKFIKACHDRPTLTVQYLSDDGKILLRTGGTIAWRFNNPGNIRPKNNGTYPGQIGTGNTKSGNFAIFESYEIGRREKKALLRRKYNNYSLKDALYIYAPPNENDTEAYIAYLIKHTGFNQSTILSSLDDKGIDKLMDAMERKEGYYNTDTQPPRSDKWIGTTTVNVGNGSHPLAEQKIIISYNGKKKEYITNENGNLPPIPHVKQGGKIYFSTMVNGCEILIGEVVTSVESQVVSLVNNAARFTSKLMPQNESFSAKKDDIPKFNYVVVNGDVLSKIAKRFRVTSQQIQEWNHIKNKNEIYAGQILAIGYFVRKNNEDKKDKSKNSSSNICKVKSGDTIYKICKSKDISIDNFMKANPQIKERDTILVGQIVTIPRSVSNTHIKQKSETNNQKSNVVNTVDLTSRTKTISSSGNNIHEVTRSKSGTGEGLAILSVNNREAPWMPIVIRELKQWYGKREGAITKQDNYHMLTGSKINTLVGSTQAWCASFANYCLQEAKYAKSAEPTSALSFRRDTKNFVKITKPIFGALATIPTSSGASPEAKSGFGHVGFVYCLDKTSGRFLIIGGNQDDQITIASRSISAYRFYVPKAYYEFSKSQVLVKEMSVDDLYGALGLKTVRTSNATR